MLKLVLWLMWMEKEYVLPPVEYSSIRVLVSAAGLAMLLWEMKSGLCGQNWISIGTQAGITSLPHPKSVPSKIILPDYFSRLKIHEDLQYFEIFVEIRIFMVSQFHVDGGANAVLHRPIGERARVFTASVNRRIWISCDFG